jgi:hypothetical protein
MFTKVNIDFSSAMIGSKSGQGPDRFVSPQSGNTTYFPTREGEVGASYLRYKKRQGKAKFIVT